MRALPYAVTMVLISAICWAQPEGLIDAADRFCRITTRNALAFSECQVKQRDAAVQLGLMSVESLGTKRRAGFQERFDRCAKPSIQKLGAPDLVATKICLMANPQD